MSDNCIEMDGGAHTIRVFGNRALSATPLIGGPDYFFQKRRLQHHDRRRVETRPRAGDM
ncbi:MAG TPA: hypothetical protein VN654_16280 [Vicinamibacterales bacterium]|jgi:hypothetical protein|nr:hypothetical protein [Vicinamibacterales bacterium]